MIDIMSMLRFLAAQTCKGLPDKIIANIYLYQRLKHILLVD